MAALAHQAIAGRLAEISGAAERLSPLEIHARMDAIREAAAAHGLDALEGLSHRSAQLALLPGHRVTTNCCLERAADALAGTGERDRTAILAALAVRLN